MNDRPSPGVLSTRLAAVCLWLALVAPAFCRTITLKPEALDSYATLSEAHPMNGWASYNYDGTRYVSSVPGMSPSNSMLLRYSLEQIPKGMRITHAEFTIAHNVSGAKVNVWRVLAEWGLGVCHQFRMTYPEKREWTVAGARGKSTDRATNPTTSGKFVDGQLLTVNVTPDVELWYTGAAPNRGWLLTFESFALLHSPTHDGHRLKWQLRVTYEPE
jgi:hypothetical protein